MRGPVRGFAGHAATTLVAMIVGVGFLVALFNASGLIKLGGEDYRVRALVPNAATLGKGASVRMAGLKIGRVLDVERSGAAAQVTFELDEGQGPLPADSRVGIRLRSLIGENYLEVERGTSKTDLADGGVLPLRRANEYVEIDTILSNLTGETRERARAFLTSSGAALDRRGAQLNATVEGAAGLIEDSRPLLDVVARDRRAVTAFVDSFGAISRAVGDRGAALRSLARDSRAVFTAVAARDDALRRTLAALPGTLAQVRSTSGVLADTTRSATPVVADLARAVDDLEPAITRLRPAAKEGTAVLRELGRSAPRLTQTVTRLGATAAPLGQVMAPVRKLLCQVNPALKHIAPYAPEAAAMFAGIGAAANAYDATGHYARVFAMFSESSMVGYPANVSRALDELMSVGLLGKIHDLGYDAYPDQGSLGRMTKGLDATGPSDVTKPYPRIQADC